MKRNTRQAFHWIINILRKLKIPFQICGGLDARVFGSKRELADIDLIIDGRKLNLLIPEVRNYIKFGPKHYKDKSWDLTLMTLEYQGQDIDISPKRVKIFDKIKNKWIVDTENFTNSVKKKIYGLVVPVDNKRNLIAEKKKLMRRVDVVDIKAIS